MRTRMRRFNGGQRFRDPRSLFMGNAQGFWLDMTDPATWFQNSDGTTPATTLGDPVGFVADKSGQGYNAIQATSAARPTHGRMPYGGVRNQATYSEDPSNAVWGKTRVTYTAGSLAETVDAGSHVITVTGIGTIAGAKKYISFWVNKGDLAAAPDWIQISTGTTGFVATDAYRVNFNLTTMTVGATGSAVSDTSITEDGGYIRIRAAITAVSTVTAASITIGFTNNTDGSRLPSYAGNVLANIFLHKAQVENNGYTDYQKVVQAYDVTESGVASVPCLWFDGVDDYLSMTTTAASLSRNVSNFIVAGCQSITRNPTNSQALINMSVGTSANSRIFLGGIATSTYRALGRRLDADSSASAQITYAGFELLSSVGVFDYSNGVIRLLNNGIEALTTGVLTTGLTSDTASNLVLIGSNNGSSTFVSGFIAGVVAIKNTVLTESQIASLGNYFMNQTGAGT